MWANGSPILWVISKFTLFLSHAKFTCNSCWLFSIGLASSYFVFLQWNWHFGPLCPPNWSLSFHPVPCYMLFLELQPDIHSKPKSLLGTPPVALISYRVKAKALNMVYGVWFMVYGVWPHFLTVFLISFHCQPLWSSCCSLNTACAPSPYGHCPSHFFFLITFPPKKLHGCHLFKSFQTSLSHESYSNHPG